MDKVTRKPKGFGTVTFLMSEHATKAYSELDGTILDGRMLHILPGKAKANPLEDIDESKIHFHCLMPIIYRDIYIICIFLTVANLTYKQKKELKDKATAGSTHNWNTLFLGQNAVADSIAAMYNISKEKVIIKINNRLKIRYFLIVI